MKNQYYILYSLIFFTFTLSAQDFTRITPADLDTSRNYGYYFNFAQVKIHRGSNATSSKTDWVKDLFAGSGYWGADLRIGFQTTGKYEWQQVLNNPTYGFGFSYFRFDQRETSNLIGNPSGIYGFFGWPWYRGKGKKFHFDFNAAVGLTYDLNPYDPVTNPYNDAVGSRILYYFDFAFEGVQQISDRLDLNFGAHLIHFSNGRMRTPNLGVNLLGLDIGLKYNFNPMTPYVQYMDPGRQLAVRPELEPKPVLPKYKKYGILNLWAAAGFNTVSGDSIDLRGPSYFASTVAAEYQYKLGRAFSAGLGLNYFFDGSLGTVYPDGNATVLQRSTVGLGPCFDFYIHRFSFAGTVGFYIYRAEEVKPSRNVLYLRGAFRYRITEQMFAHVALKTMNGAVADYVEFGVGYSIFKNPN